jgi:hypothetical protein
VIFSKMQVDQVDFPIMAPSQKRCHRAFPAPLVVLNVTLAGSTGMAEEIA